jgi:hypothetical protein
MFSKAKRDLSKPRGVTYRTADLTKAFTILNCALKVSYKEGFKKTADCIFGNHYVVTVKANLQKSLLER